MKFQLDIFVAALGLAFILEGLPYFLAPEGVKKVLERIGEISPATIRILGLFGMAAGLALVAVSRMVG